jgi:hypothetical protein
VRCGQCGNENAEANRFCGMCGATLFATTPVPNQAPAVAPAGIPAAARPAAPAPVSVPAGLGDAPVERRPAPPPAYDAGRSSKPVISGPSFLGLSTPGPHVERHPERDPLRPSSNLDYLLEDEEEPRRGWGKLILAVVAMAMALGFGYLHWKQGGFDWLNAVDKKPVAAKPAPDAVPSPDSGSTPGGATPAAGATDTGTAPASSGAGANPLETVAGPATSSETGSQAVAAPVGVQPDAVQTAPAQTAPAQTTPAQTTPAQTTPAQLAPAPSGPAQNQAADPNLPAGNPQQAAGPDPNQPLPPAAPPPSARKTAARKPSPAKPVAAKPVDPVADAERYIYGRGVQQDCDRGLHLLKPAADQSNSKAMISLGRLYSTGTCTPRDLPSAYRWFALALRKEPDSQALQDDLQKLWSQMTQPERQLAIRLSQ